MNLSKTPFDASKRQYLNNLVRDVPDFPKPGILFKDITPLLGDVQALRIAVDALVHAFDTARVDTVVGIEARGFIFGAPLALQLGAGFVPVRKPGKLPWSVDRVTYALEYGQGELQMHKDAIKPGANVMIVDDLLATGGTAAATKQLVERQHGHLVGFGFVVELTFLKGRESLGEVPAVALLTY